MRVTNGYIYNNLYKHIQQNLSRLARTQEQLSTGRTMIRPSDSPGNISPLLHAKASLSYFEQYDRNLDDGLGYLNLSDGSMQTLGDMLNQAAQMAVQGANATYVREDLAALGEQIDKMIDHAVDLGNSSIGKKFIYAGTKNSIPPFKREGDSILYTGDLNGIYREVLSGEEYRIDAPGITTGFQVKPLVSANNIAAKVTQRQIPAKLVNTGIFIVERTATGFFLTDLTALDGVTPDPGLAGSYSWAGDVVTIDGAGDKLEGLRIDMTGTAVGDRFKITIDNQLGVFGNGRETSPGSGVYEVYNQANPKASPVDEGIFDCLFRLRDSLRRGNHADVGNCIGEAQQKMDQLLRRRVGIGSRTRHFEALKDQILDLEVKIKDFQQKLDGADMYKLSINMSHEQVVFQASLASGANMMKISLLDFLK